MAWSVGGFVTKLYDAYLEESEPIAQGHLLKCRDAIVNEENDRIGIFHDAIRFFAMEMRKEAVEITLDCKMYIAMTKMTFNDERLAFKMKVVYDLDTNLNNLDMGREWQMTEEEVDFVILAKYIFPLYQHKEDFNDVLYFCGTHATNTGHVTQRFRNIMTTTLQKSIIMGHDDDNNDNDEATTIVINMDIIDILEFDFKEFVPDFILYLKNGRRSQTITWDDSFLQALDPVDRQRAIAAIIMSASPSPKTDIFNKLLVTEEDHMMALTSLLIACDFEKFQRFKACLDVDKTKVQIAIKAIRKKAKGSNNNISDIQKFADIILVTN
jgi:hypothetical protein